MSDWHTLDTAAVVSRLQTDAEGGLSSAEAVRRLAEHGPNELVDRGQKSPWAILFEQLTATMVVILIVAAVISAIVGDFKDAIVILAIVVLNAVLGFVQENRAEKAMAALKRMAVPTVKARRGGQVVEVPARELTPGDVLILEAGDLVPADCRLLECPNLRVQEAALTGESEPVEKDATPLAVRDTPLGDRRNMVYMGTVVTYGRGLALVAETGMSTELGSIATMIQGVDREQTPLQRRLDQLGRRLAAVALVLVGIIFVQGLLRGEDLKVMIMTAIGMAVAAVPEGLPAVVTITLALGAQRMLRRHALVRKLPAVETLGSVTVICSDKTGTLTENRMTVTVLDVAGHRANLNVQSPGGAPEGDDNAAAAAASDDRHPGIALLLAAGSLCNDASLQQQLDKPGHFRAVGDPTEGALVVAAARSGMAKYDMDRAFPRVAEAPFDSERKRMTTVHDLRTAASVEGIGLDALRSLSRNPGGTPYATVTKGSVDGLLDISASVWIDGRMEVLDQSWHSRISDANNQLARNGMRVLGVALQMLDALPTDGRIEALERDLVFVGLVGMIDPPRSEVRAAVATCKAADIRPVMITGDHPLTAAHIARELGISADGQALTGQDLALMSPAELDDAVETTAVYARVSPEHKLNIVQALQRRGHIVAMTGDGVNDAPALKKADIGVAMGITGTDVSKEAAEMVLLDDNFATIVAAVEEGRVIYDNTRKFIKYLMTTNSGELVLMLTAPLFGMPLPLLPLQILWINLVTDGLPGLALGMEPAERDTMRRRPYAPGESIFARGMGAHILWVGLVMAALSLGVGYAYWRAGHPGWQTMVFSTLALSQMAHVLAIRSSRTSLFQMGLLSNKPLLGAVLLTGAAQMALLFTPVLQRFFGIVQLSAVDVLASIGLSAVIFVVVEIEKWLARRRNP